MSTEEFYEVAIQEDLRVFACVDTTNKCFLGYVAVDALNPTVEMVWVEKPHRGRGVAHRLLQVACREVGRKLAAATGPFTPDGRALASREGLERLGSRKRVGAHVADEWAREPRQAIVKALFEAAIRRRSSRVIPLLPPAS